MTDNDWFDQIYDENYKGLRAGSMQLINYDPRYTDAIEDEVQETFYLAWKKRNKLRNHPNIRGWLMETMQKRMLAFLRRAKEDKTFLSFSWDDDSKAIERNIADEAKPFPDVTESYFDKERDGKLVELLGSKSAKLFYHSCILKIPAKEIANRYGMKENTIWVRVSRMKKRLKKHPEIFLIFLLHFV